MREEICKNPYGLDMNDVVCEIKQNATKQELRKPEARTMKFLLRGSEFLQCHISITGSDSLQLLYYSRN